MNSEHNFGQNFFDPTEHTGNEAGRLDQGVTQPEGGLPSSGDVRVESGAGPDLAVTDIQSEIERTYGPSDWHVEPRHETVSSSVPPTCTDDQFAAYSGNGR